ncbi:MAG: hypothetical protein RL077_5191 [Verrucomicrobiota bacterium]
MNLPHRESLRATRQPDSAPRYQCPQSGRLDWFGPALSRSAQNLCRGLLLIFSLIVSAPRTCLAQGAPAEKPHAQVAPEHLPADKHPPQRNASWGTIDCSNIFLEAPNSLIDSASRADQVPVWHFPGTTRDSLEGLLVKASLTEATIAALLKAEHTQVNARGITLLPPSNILVELTPNDRQALYTLLAASPENDYHANPQLITGNIDEWLWGTHLSDLQKNIFKKTLWHRGRVAAFSDVSLLIQTATSREEVAAALRTMTRTQTFTARVRRDPHTTTEQEFIDYWSAGGRNSDALPMMRALVESTTDRPIDINLLLPTLCRERLYTFPSLSDAIGGRLPDCNWTALNFFSEKPEPYFLDSKTSSIEIKESYAPLAQPSALGDLICFISPTGEVFHSCVYLADDIVFTKNGESPFAPWILMKLKNVAARYDHRDGSTVAFLRKKP